jgi:GNAT superfamily N-acetyltransferase
LPPDIRFELLPKTPAASEWAFEIKRAAIGPHIIARWGWDEQFLKDFHERRFRECPLSSIVQDDNAIGTVALTKFPDCIQLDEFYLLPPFHRRGLGTRILLHCLSLANELSAPVRLRYLKWNPVGSLYRRHGFHEVGQTDIHYLMLRPPGSLQDT